MARRDKPQLRALATVAALGPEGGLLKLRTPLHSTLDMLGWIELTGNHAVVTGEGLDALAAARKEGA